MASYQYLRSSRQDLALYFQDKTFESQARVVIDELQLWAAKMNDWNNWDPVIKDEVEAVSQLSADNPYNYAVYFFAMSFNHPDRQKVKKLNRTLQSFWQSTFTLKEEFSIPSDIFKKGHWVERAKAYRHVMEPIDISNYYSSNLDGTSGGYDESDNRPNDYVRIEELEGANNALTVAERMALAAELVQLRTDLGLA